MSDQNDFSEPLKIPGKHRFMAGTCVDCGRPLDEVCTASPKASEGEPDYDPKLDDLDDPASCVGSLPSPPFPKPAQDGAEKVSDEFKHWWNTFRVLEVPHPDWQKTSAEVKERVRQIALEAWQEAIRQQKSAAAHASQVADGVEYKSVTVLAVEHSNLAEYLESIEKERESLAERLRTALAQLAQAKQERDDVGAEAAHIMTDLGIDFHPSGTPPVNKRAEDAEAETAALKSQVEELRQALAMYRTCECGHPENVHENGGDCYGDHMVGYGVSEPCKCTSWVDANESALIKLTGELEQAQAHIAELEKGK